MLQKTRCVILSHVKYGDSSLIVRAFTEQFGRQSFIVHGVRKRKSRFSLSLFSPLSLLDIEIYYKQDRDLHTLKEAQPGIILQHINFDVKKSTIAIFISEILGRTLQEIESNRELFDFLLHAIQILDVAESGIENFHLLFLLQFSKFLGIYPRNNLELSHYLTSGNIQIADLLDHSLTEIDNLSLSHVNRAELLDQIILYYHHHLEGIGEIKSLPVLRSVFH